MAFTPAIPLQPQTWEKMLFDGTVTQAAEIAAAVDGALAGGILIRAAIEAHKEADNQPQWRIRLQPPTGPELLAETGHWIVVSSLGKIRVLDDTEYHAEFE